MPVQRCKRDGHLGWKWGGSGRCYTGTGAKAKANRQGRAIRASGYTGNQATDRTRIVPSNPLKADPTRTTMLRARFVRALQKRFRKLKGDILRLIDKEDALGIKPSTLNPLTGNVQNQRWRFRTDSQKVQAFQGWIQSQVNDNILPAATEQAYWEQYVQEGYRKGAGRAFDDTRKPALAAGSEERLAFYEGTKQEFLRSAFAHPESVDKVKLLAGRVFTDLKDVTDAMSTRMTRTLADGLVQGQNPRQIARSLNKAVNVGIKRARTIARTEIIRAHAEGQLDAMEQLGVTEVGVAVEWSTAGDDRVCPLCVPLDGVVFKIKEARGLLPRHPNCRCAHVPANVGESTAGQKRTRARIQTSVDKSLKAEAPKGRSLKAQKRLSSWPGAGKSIAKRRPKSIIRSDDRIPGVSPRVGISSLEPAPVPPESLKLKSPRTIPCESTSPFCDRKTQMMMAEYRRIWSSKRIKKSIKIKKLDRLSNQLKAKGLRYQGNGIWADAEGITAPHGAKLSSVKSPPVRTSYQSEFLSWQKSVTQAEKEGIEFWSESGYGVQSVREAQAGMKVAETIKNKVAAFDKAMSRAPRHRGVIYRGQVLDNVDDLKIGDTFEFGHSVSASKSIDVAEEFAGYASDVSPDSAVLFEIKQKSAVDISNLVIEEYKDQAEAYLHKGGKFRVISTEKQKNWTKVTLEEI